MPGYLQKWYSSFYPADVAYIPIYIHHVLIIARERDESVDGASYKKYGVKYPEYTLIKDAAAEPGPVSGCHEPP